MPEQEIIGRTQQFDLDDAERAALRYEGGDVGASGQDETKNLTGAYFTVKSMRLTVWSF